MKRIITKALVLVLVACLLLPALFACGPKTDDDATTKGDTTPNYQPIDLADVVEHESDTSVYDMIGTKVTIDMVVEDEDGMATVTVDGVTYTLGMDFLSMAMVYNTSVPADSEKYKTETDVYNEWWKLYIQRWNYLMPEIPLYSNQYFDVYNAKLENFVTSPYWGADDAIVSATVKAGEANSVILGSSTDLSGAFRNSSWGKSSPGASDLAIQKLVSGYATVITNMGGSYEWNDGVLASEPTSEVNEDGTLTWTIEIKPGLKFSDNSEITAKHYIASLLAGSTVVAQAAGGTGNAGQTIVGFKAFKLYDGTNDGAEENGVTASKYFSGVKLLGDYKFSVTLTADYAGYYYSMLNADFGPSPLALYLGANGDIVVDPETKACALNDAFYATTGEGGEKVYTTAGEIVANLKWNSALPYSGPYVVSNYDEKTKIATLTLNPVYPGEKNRGTATIETITYIKVVTETQTDMLQRGEVDVIEGITGGDETKAILKIVNNSNGKFAETHYDRAGYGKLGFRADFGPTGMTEVRQAIAYTINRPAFAQAFTGGYGSVANGPFYAQASAYIAVKDEINLNAYTYSTSAAIAVLEAAGWTYNGEGGAYDANVKDAYGNAIRYKKLSGYELSEDNLKFSTVDGKYKTVKIDGSYYMPLAINWYGTTSNPVTDLLNTDWYSSTAPAAIGMYIQQISADFNTALYGELSRMTEYGYDGTPKLNAVNFATGFNSAVYDYSFNWTINKDYYEDYTICYVKDEADFYENYPAPVKA